MRNLRYIILRVLGLVTCFVLFVPWSASAKEVIHVRAWRLQDPIGMADSVSAADTSYLNFPMRNALYDYSICNVYNGNLVSPVQSAIYFDRTAKVDFVLGRQYDPYTITPQDVRFFSTTTPYSYVSYKKGFKTYHEDNDLAFMFTGNLNEKTNFGLSLNYLNAVGHYQNQAGKVFNGSVFGSYNGNHYSLQAAFTFNNLSNFENGGIRNMEDIQNTDLNTEDIPTSLEAMSGYRYLSGYVNHYYSICVERKEKVHYRERDEEGNWQEKDSTKINYVPVTTFRHVFEVNDANRRYIEKNASQSFYDVTYRNPKLTNDSASALTIRNTLSVTFEEEFNTKLKFGATVYATNEAQCHLLGVGQPEAIVPLEPFNNPLGVVLSQTMHHVPDTLYQSLWSNNTFVGGELYKNRGKYVFYGFGGEVCLLGRKIGQFNVHGHVDAGFRLGKDSMTISAEADLRNVTPDFYHLNYNSNHYQWYNDFKKPYVFHVAGRLAYPTKWVHTQLGVDYENLTNHIYFGPQGTPIQSEENISIIAANLQLNLITPWVNMDNSVVYQYVSSPNIPLPTLALYSNLYYHGTWFKALDVQIGVDVQYNTAYYAPLLDPATGQFCVQDKVKIGNYPIMSAYANFYVKLLHLRFFAQYQHLNASFMNYQYFTMPNYPLNPDVFRAGLAFHFYK